ncbi:MAG TPA: YciI family protein [Terriglobia bacterium]|nr:YciI family protein [Terriglobia bacterium]
MKHFAALLHLQDAEKNVSLRPRHLAFLAAQEAAGKVFARGPFADGTGGLVIYRSESLEKAGQLAESDPYVAEGARRLELHEWRMTTGDDMRSADRALSNVP